MTEFYDSASADLVNKACGEVVKFMNQLVSEGACPCCFNFETIGRWCAECVAPRMRREELKELGHLVAWRLRSVHENTEHVQGAA